MAIDPKQKLEALNSELSQVAENYNKQLKLLKNSSNAYMNKGGIAALEKVIAKSECFTLFPSLVAKIKVEQHQEFKKIISPINSKAI
ncbi:MAG: hypothetical protein CM15mV93_030 [Caudoviricetes sp.]|nr:MAG: hypothetical protein CM15mV93_030 [Caudoviricetes sp.]